MQINVTNLLMKDQISDVKWCPEYFRQKNTCTYNRNKWSKLVACGNYIQNVAEKCSMKISFLNMNALTFKNSYLSILVQKSNVIPLLKAKTTIKRFFFFFFNLDSFQKGKFLICYSVIFTVPIKILKCFQLFRTKISKQE